MDWITQALEAARIFVTENNWICWVIPLLWLL